jgi:serine/threonine-protein kinase RsbW
VEQGLSKRCACEMENLWEIAHISAVSDPQCVSGLRHEIMEFFNASAFPQPDLADLETAIGEACTNALKHGSPRGDLDEVRAKCMRNRHTLIVEISDNGCGFDPERAPAPPPDKLFEGGMGVFIMKALTDTVEFEFRHGTTVRLVKHLRQTPESN